MIQSFEYDQDLQFYNEYVTEALLATIDAEVNRFPKGNPNRPSFVIHTGDAIDSGVMSELHRVHELIDGFVPFFHVLGNHDVLTFGNLVPTDKDNDSSCATVTSVSGPTPFAFLVPNKICVSTKK